MGPGSSLAQDCRSTAAWGCDRRASAGRRSNQRRNRIMADKKPVIVYGASGYTGRLVCEYLRELHVPFIAAGRDRARTQAVTDKIPGIETADYEVAAVEHSVKALAGLFD